jgi:hypothetical protein
LISIIPGRDLALVDLAQKRLRFSWHLSATGWTATAPTFAFADQSMGRLRSSVVPQRRQYLTENPGV